MVRLACGFSGRLQLATITGETFDAGQHTDVLLTTLE